MKKQRYIMQLNDLEIFYHVAQLKSFSAAARSLGFSKSFISKRISALEESLKVKLLTRSTRKITLTEAGHIFYRHCTKIIGEAQSGFSEVAKLKAKPSGTLKISMPPALANYLLVPMINDFHNRYPDVKLNIQLTSQIVDVIKGRYDCVLRCAKLKDSNFISSKLHEFSNTLCATPAYLNHHGELTKPADLAHHHCITYGHDVGKHYWNFKKAGKSFRALLNDHLLTNQLEFSKALVLRNFGISLLPNFMLQAELKAKKLVSCLNGYAAANSEIYALYPEREYLLPKVRVFIDELKAYLTKQLEK